MQKREKNSVARDSTNNYKIMNKKRACTIIYDTGSFLTTDCQINPSFTHKLTSSELVLTPDFLMIFLRCD